MTEFIVKQIKKNTSRKEGEEDTKYKVIAEDDLGRKLSISQDFEPNEEIGDTWEWSSKTIQHRLVTEPKRKVKNSVVKSITKAVDKVKSK